MPGDYSAAPDGAGLKLKWADGWIEHFPEREFAKDCEGRPRKIRMYKTGQAVAIEYALTVRGRDALLDYGGDFEKRNRAPDRAIYIGVTRIRFTDFRRTVVESVAWCDSDKRHLGARGFTECDVDVFWSRDPRRFELGPFRVPLRGDRRLPAVASAVPRPGQLRFREDLLDVYESRCCVTGCDIPTALEAAHIIAFRESACDDPRNGLLVRADLHRLFDELLWSVNPRSLRIAIAPRLARVPEYSGLDGRRLTLPQDRRLGPAYAALKDHWRRFNASIPSAVGPDARK